MRVLPGNYDEQVTINRGGTAGARVQWISDTKWGARMRDFFIRRSNDTIADSGGTCTDIINFEIVGGTNGWESDCSYSSIIGCKLHDGGGVHTYTAPWPGPPSQPATNYYPTTGCVVDKNLVYNIPNATAYQTGNAGQAHGIYMEGELETVSNNLVFHAQGWGIHSFHTCNKITIVNNVVIENGVGGIVIGGEADNYPTNAPLKKNDQSLVANNICRHNGVGSAISPAYGIVESGNTGPNNRYINNLLYQNLPNDTVGPLTGGTVSGTLTSDPQFVNYQSSPTVAGADYHLQASSPALNAGTATGAPAADYDGVSRPQGVAYDIGAYEYVTGSSLLVQHNVASGAGTTTFPITLSAAVVVGHRLILRAAAWESTPPVTVTAVTDNLGNTWRNTLTQAGLAARLTDVDGGDHTIWDAVVTTGGSLTVTVTLTGGVSGDNRMTLLLQEYQGLSVATSNYLDGAAARTGSGTNASSGAASLAPSATGELAIGMISDAGYNDSALAAGSGWSQIDRFISSGFPDLLAEDQLTVTGVAPNATSTSTAGAWAAAVVVFKLGWALVQHNVATGAGTATFTISLINTVAVGDRLILRAAAWEPTPVTIIVVTDNLGNTWRNTLTQAGLAARITDADGGDHTLWDAVVTTGGAITVTVTLSGGVSGDNRVSLFLQEYSGLSSATSSYLDGAAARAGTGANASSGAASIAATSSGELAVGMISDAGYNDSTLASGSGWSQVDRFISAAYPDGLIEDQSTVAGVAPNATSTSSAGAWAALLAVFKLAGAADPTAPSIPGGLTATAINSGRITLAWTPSSDNVGVTGYTVYRGLGVSRDLHLNGPEFGLSTVSGATGSFSNLNPGTIDSQYHYDGQASFNYLAGRGYRRVKLPIRWERIQPTLNAALNAAELTRLTSCLDRINAAGLKVILDVHNYGIYYKDATPLTAPGLVASGSGSTLLAGTYTVGCTWWNSSDSSLSATAQITISAGQNIVMTSTGVPSTISSVNFWLIAAPATTTLGYLSGAGIGGGTASYTLTSRTQGTGGAAPGTGIGRAITLGDSELTVAAFSDLWTRLATAFKTHGAIANGGAYCIMTEPQNSQGLTAATWKTASQAAVTAIRAVDAATCIHVCGFNWANTRNWAGINGGGTWITDPSNNLRYEAHCYFDDQVGGQYSNTYAQEVTNATNAGFTAGSNVDAEHSRIRADISSFQSWLTTNGVRGVLGEIGWPNTPSGEQAQWNALGNVILADCDSNAIETVVWQGGEWSTDKLTVYTGGFGTISTANAQAATSEAHHSFVTPQLGPSGGVGYNDLSVLPTTTYLYSVDAYDAAGNHSAQSAWASATTPASVLAPPAVPGWPRLVRVSIPFN